LKDHYPDTKWLEIKIEEPGELCIDEKKLYRILSNSKQSVGGESNRNRLTYSRNLPFEQSF